VEFVCEEGCADDCNCEDNEELFTILEEDCVDSEDCALNTVKPILLK